MSSSIEIQIVAVLIAVACSLVGVFLVLRKNAMMADVISHTVLLGITLMFFLVKNLNSPLLLVGATLMGLLTVWFCEALTKTNLVREDSAMALVFPLLFSFAIILITKYASQTHLCIDTVMVGELAFVPFQRMVLFGTDIGAKGIYRGLGLLLMNAILIKLFFKELQITAFDPILASTMGFSPVLIHYGLMTVVSVTAVVSFDVVGSVLVIAFMTVPANTAYLLTKKLSHMLWLSGLFGGVSGVIGFRIAYYYDVSIAGMIAAVSGGIFLLVFVFSPKQGLLYHVIRRRIQEKQFAEMNLLFHVGVHEHTPQYKEENGILTIGTHLHWTPRKLQTTIQSLLNKGEVEQREGVLYLTEKGEESSKTSVAYFLKTN